MEQFLQQAETAPMGQAFMFKARATPDDAYRYAQGHPIAHALGFDIQLQGEVLDFAAVTDHGELHEWYLGEWQQEFLIKKPADNVINGTYFEITGQNLEISGK